MGIQAWPSLFIPGTSTGRHPAAPMFRFSEGESQTSHIFTREAGSWRTFSELSQPELFGPVLLGELKEITAEAFFGGHSQNQVMFHMRKRESVRHGLGS